MMRSPPHIIPQVKDPHVGMLAHQKAHHHVSCRAHGMLHLVWCPRPQVGATLCAKMKGDDSGTAEGYGLRRPPIAQHARVFYTPLAALPPTHTMLH